MQEMGNEIRNENKSVHGSLWCWIRIFLYVWKRMVEQPDQAIKKWKDDNADDFANKSVK